MAAHSFTEGCRPGDTLVVVHEFEARSPDELSLRRGDRIELIERDDDFGDGWFLGKNTETGENGLFPEVYTRPAPKPTPIPTMLQRAPSQASARHDQSPVSPISVTTELPATQSLPAAPTSTPAPLKSSSSADPLHVAPGPATPDLVRRTSLSTAPRTISMTLSGEPHAEDEAVASPVMHETLSVIDEHITDMSTPRHSAAGKDLRPNDSGSEYSSQHRLSYVHGHETEEEEIVHTEEEVKSWSPARVAEYLEEAGVEKRHCEVFREQEIDGEALLGVDRNFIFMQEFNLGPMGPRLRTWMKINALQSEVKAAKEAAKVIRPQPSTDGNDDYPTETLRNRAASTSAVLPRIPSLREGIGSRGGATRQGLPRAASSAGRSNTPTLEPPPAASQVHSPIRPSAASIRNLNHNRRHSSIDFSQGPLPPTSPPATKPPHSASGSTSHKKTPSFDRNWSMGHSMKMSQDLKRPSSSHHAQTASANGINFDSREREVNALNDLDRGYFSGGEVDNRKGRNLLRKKESPMHSRNPSYNTDTGRRTSFARHSRIGSTDSIASSAHVSNAAKQYYGTHVKGERSTSAFDFVRPLKPTTDLSPTVTKLNYDSPSIDAIANSPRLPGSETSSTGRASPSPAVPSFAQSFFNRKPKTGLRAISDAVTGGERANAAHLDPTSSPNKDSPMQSPSRTGSTTPSGTSATKSFELENPDVKRLTTASTSTKDTARRKSKKHTTSAYQKGRQQITPQEAMANCDYSGWMKKKSSSLMTTWKTRLFVLRGRRLAYYYDENDTEEKGLIDISSHRVLPANNERITGLHATITRAASSPSSPQNATIQTTASTDSANGIEEDMTGMFIFKLVPPRAGLQRGVQFTKPIVHYFAVSSLAVGRLWMAALMKATIDRDEALPFTTTYQQKTISLEKARAMRQRPPNLMDDDDMDTNSADYADNEKKSEYSKESMQDSTTQEEDEKGLAITGMVDAKSDYTETREPHLAHENAPAMVAT